MSFARFRDQLVSFDPRDVTRSLPVDKSIWIRRNNKPISRVFELEASLALPKTIRLFRAGVPGTKWLKILKEPFHKCILRLKLDFERVNLTNDGTEQKRTLLSLKTVDTNF